MNQLKLENYFLFSLLLFIGTEEFKNKTKNESMQFSVFNLSDIVR
jgi:hypothetical protein